MIPKIILSGYDTTGHFPPAALLSEFSKGFDRNQLQKRASVFTNDDYNSFDRRPGHSYIHLISAAAGEYYGHNSRADYYNGGRFKFSFPKPERGVSPVRELDGGLSLYHKTFIDNGAVYTEHCNKHNKATPQGYIVAQKYNEPMHRGELIIGVKTSMWEPDIRKLEKGIPMKFSIGADAAYDICSICGHEAHTEKGHCTHYKNQPGQWDENGHAVFVISDKLCFHDISRVAVPAEKIAFSIRKVAGEDLLGDALFTHHQSAAYFVKTATGRKRLKTLEKLAKIEKQILAEAAAGGLNQRLAQLFKFQKKACDDGVQSLHRFVEFAKEGEVFGGLQANKCVLPVQKFIELLNPALHKDIDYNSAEHDSTGIFNALLNSDDVEEFCNDDSYEGCPCYDINILQAAKQAKATCGTDFETVSDGLLGSQPNLKSHVPSVIVCVKSNKDEFSPLALEHANYMTSACGDLSDDEIVTAVLRQLI